MAGGGSFDYPSGGCGSASYMNRASEGSVFGSASYRHESGVTGVVEVSGAAAKTVGSRLVDRGEYDDDPPLVDEDEIGRVRNVVAVAPRLGFHHDYFGAEAGALLYAGGDDGSFLDHDGEFRPLVLPSGMLWAGVPEVAFLQLDFLRGATSLGHLPIQAGIGHSGDRVRANLAVAAEGALVLDGSVRPFETDPFWLGARLVQNVQQYGTFGALSWAYAW
jgi:hypothetical protein